MTRRAKSVDPEFADSIAAVRMLVSVVPEPDLQVVRPSVGRPPAQEGKRHIDEEDQNAHREDISADGRHQVPDILAAQQAHAVRPGGGRAVGNLPPCEQFWRTGGYRIAVSDVVDRNAE